MANLDVQALRNQILEIVKREGPVLPAQISEKVASNILFTSAILADLVSQNAIKISRARIGSSPVYYSKGQEYKLQMLYKHLGEKPRKIYDILKEKKVLRDKALESWQRVAIREIKDFAIMLDVNFKTGQEIFWKWYMTPEEEAKQKIIDVLKKDIPEEKIEPKKEILEEQLPKKEEVIKDLIVKKEEIKKETISDVKEKKDVVKELKEVKEELKKLKEPKEKKGEKQIKLKEDKKVEKIEKFYNLINKYFAENRIKVIEEKTLRKNTEYEFIVEIPSSMGNLQYFVKAKNKRKVSDSEINMAYTVGEKKKLPTMILSTGDLTRKAEKYLEELKGLVFKRIV